MTDKNAGLLPVNEKKFNYELKYDRSECGSAGCTYYALVTDYHSPADILIRWPMHGFWHHVENAAEKAEELAKEVVKRWNAYITPPAEAVTEDAREAALKALDGFKNEILSMNRMVALSSDRQREYKANTLEKYETIRTALQSPSKAVAEDEKLLELHEACETHFGNGIDQTKRIRKILKLI